jgi:hypothetical protein
MIYRGRYRLENFVEAAKLRMENEKDVPPHPLNLNMRIPTPVCQWIDTSSV